MITSKLILGFVQEILIYLGIGLVMVICWAKFFWQQLDNRFVQQEREVDALKKLVAGQIPNSGEQIRQSNSDRGTEANEQKPQKDDLETLNILQQLDANDWEQFQVLLEQRFPGFQQQVKEQYPNLTNAETQMLLLLKAGFDQSQLPKMFKTAPGTAQQILDRLYLKITSMATSHYWN